MTAPSATDGDVRDVARFVTITIPNVRVEFDDVGDDYNEDSALEAAVDYVINEIDEVMARFEISDEDKQLIKSIGGTIKWLRWGPGLLMISPIVTPEAA